MSGIKKILLTGAAATSLMTLFSHAASKLKGENHNEAELLAGLIEPLLQQNQPLARPLGWMAHYVLGIGWVMVNDASFTSLHIKRNMDNSLLAGAIGGLTGVLIWKKLFKMSHAKPQITLGYFYRQLFLAHLIFMLGFAIVTNKKPINRLTGH